MNLEPGETEERKINIEAKKNKKGILKALAQVDLLTQRVIKVTAVTPQGVRTNISSMMLQTKRMTRTIDLSRPQTGHTVTRVVMDVTQADNVSRTSYRSSLQKSTLSK